MSTFSGQINEINGVSIDRFDGANLSSVAYFLSHCHTDHMEGIRDHRFINRLAENSHINLYCSDITSLILKLNGLSSVCDKIIGLPIGPENTLTIPRGKDDEQVITVTLIPAGHCPGSVMFLFEGASGKILYTGDFRISAQDVKSFQQFYDSYGQTKPITKMYLDTTFIGLYGTKAEVFPSRKESAVEVIRLISQWLKQGNGHFVNLFTSARYGSEYLIMDIATKLGTQIRVPDINYRVYNAIPEISWAVTNNPCAKIQSYGQSDKHAYSKWRLSFKKTLQCANVSKNVSEHKVRTIKPAALWWCNNHSRDQTISSKSTSEFFRVMYACHSSPQEIKALLDFLRPCAIEPCVIPRGFTYDQISSICYSMTEQLRPVTSCVSYTPPLNEGSNGSVCDLPVASNTDNETEVIDLVSDSDRDSETTSHSDPNSQTVSDSDPNSWTTSDSDPDTQTPSPTYKLSHSRGLKRKWE